MPSPSDEIPAIQFLVFSVCSVGSRLARTLFTSLGIGLTLLTRALPAQSPPHTPFTSGAWNLTLGGYLKLDLIHDFDANGSPDTFDPRAIPVDGTKGTNTRVRARETRLSLDLQGPAEGRNLELFVEGDFYGAGN